ncbi:nucleotidyltransferase family protein [Roseateles sp.]|uniref:nucleotidyltransferase family protein n=1 Tax=Roseateles sp. TaxID=1971397 RepID=UPI002DF82347|nr:nucleotidyltransferase family protein [Roseateles sp.]
MSELDESLPNAAVLQATLKAATDRLAAELVTPTAQAPRWNDFEWRTAMAVSVMHGISGLLAERLRWQGPPAWQAFLAEQLDQSRRRERRARELLARLDRSAREAGLPLLAMKGSALLALGLYAPGERPMSDVDLLARPQDLTAADRVIQALGYERQTLWPRHDVYEPKGWGSDRAFGEHEANPTKIELHPAVEEPLPLQEVDITASLFPAAPRAGVNPYASPAALMRHLLLHTAGNLCHRSVRLIQLHDIALLGATLDAGAWREALAPASDGRPAWWAVPPLALARRLFPGRLPEAVLDEAMAPAIEACPHRLRRRVADRGLAEWSLSHLALPMLPGFEWSHSASETAAYAWRRLRPPCEERIAGRKAVAREHLFASSAWARKPRWLKALSFLLGSPPRVQTIYNLHRALAYRPSSSA